MSIRRQGPGGVPFAAMLVTGLLAGAVAVSAEEPSRAALIEEALSAGTPAIRAVAKVGVAYMLAGESGSNTDPYAEGPTEHNHWATEGPHVMIIVPDRAHLAGLPATPQTEGA